MPSFHTTFYVCFIFRPHPVDNAGFLSFMTFAWMTPLMWSILRNKLDISELKLSPFDIADTSAQRSFLFILYSDLNTTYPKISQGITVKIQRHSDSWKSTWNLLSTYNIFKKKQTTGWLGPDCKCLAGFRDSGMKKWQRGVWKKPHWFVWPFTFNEPGWLFLSLLVFLPWFQHFWARWVIISVFHVLRY